MSGKVVRTGTMGYDFTLARMLLRPCVKGTK